jgi:uncharacterized membrane protein
MTLTEIFALLSRWLHIIPAIILVGGTLFMRFSLVPATEELNASAELRESIRKRWARLVMISVLFLLVSGLYNTMLKVRGFETGDTAYNALLLVKVILALAIFFLASVMSGRSKMAQKFRLKEKHWLNVLCLMMLVVVAIAGYMKMDSASYLKKIKSDESASLHFRAHPKTRLLDQQ